MRKTDSDSEPATEVVSVVYKSNFWKFFFSFLFIITTAVGAYLVWVAPVDSDVVGPDAAVTDNSFFSSVGSNTKEALTRVFSGDVSERLVEVVDVTGVDSAGVEISEEEADESLFVADEPDEAGVSSAPPGAAGGAEQVVALCSFDTNQSPSHKGIVISEVAWMGGASASGLTSNDEWIELLNTSGTTLELHGWQVIDEAEQVRVVLNGNVSAGGFYLLERSDDGSVPGVFADGIYSGALSNTNEGLRLFDDSCGLVDEVFANPDWPAGDASSRRTMQREDNLSWSTFGGEITNGIWGTPGSTNGEPFVEDEDNADSPQVEDAIEEAPVPQEESETPPESDNAPNFSGLAIDNVIFDVEGADGGNERVVISNGGNADVDLSGASFQYLGPDGDFTKIKKKNFESGNTIQAGGTFIIGMNCHESTPCTGVSMSWSQALGNTSGTVFIVINQDKLVDGGDLDIVNKFDYET